MLFRSYELLIDKKLLSNFCTYLCKEIDVKPFGNPKIERFGEGNLEGLSAMQFIETSTLVVHLDEINLRAFIDIFACKKFNDQKAMLFSKEFFKSKEAKLKTLFRG